MARSGRLRRAVGALAAACVVAGGSPAWAQAAPDAPDPLNPLTGGLLFYSTQAPVQRMRMGFLHQGPELPAAGQLTAGLNVTWTNTWNYSRGAYQVDDEAWWVDLIAEYGLGGRAAVSVSVPTIYLGGGVMDGYIESFHKLFGLGNEGRDEASRNRLNISVGKDGDKQVFFTDSDRGLYPRAPVISARVGLAEGAYPLTFKVSVSIPALERRIRYVHTAGADVGLSIATDHAWTRSWSSTASLAYQRARESDGVEISLRNWSFSGVVNLSYRWNEAAAVVFQVLQVSGAGHGTGSDYDAATTEVLIGFQRRLGPTWMVELGLVENSFVTDNGIDFGVFGSAVARY